jgi:hypothetical protein
MGNGSYGNGRPGGNIFDTYGQESDPGFSGAQKALRRVLLYNSLNFCGYWFNSFSAAMVLAAPFEELFWSFVNARA